MKDKSYRATPIGGEVGRFLRDKRWKDSSDNTLLSYETTLSRLSLDFAHRELGEITLEDLLEFLDEHWGEASPNTRRQRLACIKSFFKWAKTRGLDHHPIAEVEPPKKVDIDRDSYTPDVIEKLREAQPTLRDQICVQLLGRLGLRRNELRLIQIGDFDLARGTVKVHAKGGHIHTVPLGFPTLKKDVETYIVGRAAESYLLNPKGDERRPMSNAAVHKWFKQALRTAGLSESIQLHEMRHSAGNNLWRESGDIVLAQQLLRHRSVETTQLYLHPSMGDLEAALAAFDREMISG
jgi:integrase/recombinase XerD